MSIGKKQNDKRPNDIGANPTRSFDGSNLGPGSQISQFRIEQELGRGAAGVVYLAYDTKLDRPIAIKGIPVELLKDPKVRSRFSREAHVLASLNHPNIATIYDEIKEADGVDYIILEYIPGQTLAERIAKKPLKLEEALTIALQIAEAVSAAHEHDVIHRDLKPGNIKITPEGNVKVLDFGLAKVMGTETSDKHSTITEPGRVIGTPAYMSPEQARGKPVDKRCDIWSFGCVLYEMLTGKVPFEGETVSDTLAQILQTEPDWQALPQGTPANIQVLLRRCLQKDPHYRLHDIADAVIEIRDTLNLSPATSSLAAPSFSIEPHVAVKAKPRRIAIAISVAVVVVMAGIAVWFVNRKPPLPLSKEPKLVVLPFKDLESPEDDLFANGITDAITTRLAVIPELRVIWYQSAIQIAMQIEKGEKTVQQIANDLEIDYILDGTIQRERPSDPNSKVEIRPKLIRVSDNTYVWGKSYNNVMREIYQLQSDVADWVAQELSFALDKSGPMPTENIDAYEYYLQGNNYYNRSYLESDFRIAIQMYEKAVELDPTFALAYARLSEAHSTIYWFHYDHSYERLALAKQAVDKAFRLNPEMPEVHLALGLYYFCNLDYDRALEEFAIARKSQPNNSHLLFFIAAAQGHQGKFEQALANKKRAYELDPLSNTLAGEVGYTFLLLRKYPEAERYFNRAISLAPDVLLGYYIKAWLYLLWEGSTEKARAVLEGAPENIKSGKDIVNLLVDIDVFEGNYQEALNRLSLKSEDVDNMYYFIPYAQRYALIYGYMDKKELSEKYYDEARSILETKIEEQPGDARFHSALGIAYAGLGRKEDAVREGKRAVDLLPVSKDVSLGLIPVEGLARIYVMIGEFDTAVDQLEFLLERPSELSIPLLRLDPAWDPLRDHPRFKKLLEEGK